jgi:hypothetical protein
MLALKNTKVYTCTDTHNVQRKHRRKINLSHNTGTGYLYRYLFSALWFRALLWIFALI